MAVLLGVLAGAFSGAGDFFGGIASRRGRVFAVSTGAHAAGLVTALVLAPLLPGRPEAVDMWWGAAAGVMGGLGILALYRGFTASALAVVSPIAAVGAAGWPVLFSLATGEVPTGVQAAGLVAGFAAIWTISRSPSSPGPTGTVAAGVGYGVLSGVGFGGLLVFLSFVGDDAGIWPILPARVAGGFVVAAVGVAAARTLVPLVGSLRAVAAAGALTVVGNGLFILAANRGSLAVVSVLTAMFPAATVLLARVFLRERLGATRRAGLGLALVAVALVAGG